MARLLLAKGANPFFCDGVYQRTCLHYAAQFGWASCCTVLLSDSTHFGSSNQLLRNVETRTRDGQTRKQAPQSIAPDFLGTSFGSFD